jgi:hypothetical protein
VYCYKRLDYFWPDISGRAGTNYPEPDINSLLHTLKKGWNSEAYEKSTVPILAEIGTNDLDNVSSGRFYNY